MTKDEALKLALEALEDLGMKHYESTGEVLYKETFTAIKESLTNEALEKMAENARELGLDYEPKQEPVAWEQFYPDMGKPQLAIAQRKPLTDEDIGMCLDAGNGSMSKIISFIEAKLKEKNT